MPLIHLGCPSCGGTLSLEEGTRLVDCRYCRSGGLALVPGSVPRYAAALAVSEEAARDVARAALRRPSVPRPLRAAARFEGVTLCYAPFYEATGVRLGRFFLTDRVKPPAPLGEGARADAALQRWLAQPATETSMTRIVQQDVSTVGPACLLAELGVERIDLAGLRRGGGRVQLAPFDPVALRSRAVVFTPTVSAEQFLDRAALRLPARGDETRIVGQRLKLLYYPIWQLRYRYLGRAYEIAVDGVTGAMLHGTAPRSLHAAAAVTAGGVGVLAFGLGRLVRDLGHGTGWLGRLGVADLPGFGSGLALLTIAAGVVLALLGWRWLVGDPEIDLAAGSPLPGNGDPLMHQSTS